MSDVRKDLTKRLYEATAQLGEMCLEQIVDYAEELVVSQEKAREHDAAYDRAKAELAEFEEWKAEQRANAAAYNSPPLCAGHNFDTISGRCFKCQAKPTDGRKRL